MYLCFIIKVHEEYLCPLLCQCDKSVKIVVQIQMHFRPVCGYLGIQYRISRYIGLIRGKGAGIACVYQELNIVPMLPVVDNVFMGRKITKPSGLLDYPRMHKEAHEALELLGHPEVDTHKECGKLGMGLQQMVEIAKALGMTKSTVDRWSKL